LSLNERNLRQVRGLAIIAMGSQIRRINSTEYHVRSQSGNGWYRVLKDGLEWKCECPDHVTRRLACKHIYAVSLSLNLREKVTAQNLGLDLLGGVISCKFCGSNTVIRIGFRNNKTGTVQRYLCKECNRNFVLNEGFENMKHNPKAITVALDLYFKGVSLRKIRDHLKQFYGIKITHVAILKWIRKYVILMKEYVKDLKPQVSGIWHSDEMTANVNGEYSWLWNLMDNETRFLLASQISKRREVDDARKVFAEGKSVAQARPMVVVTDGLQSYNEAFDKEFWTMKGPRTEHIRLPSIRERPNNNLVERLHGTIRERTKVMRGFDNEESASTLIDGERIYYNFLRPHMSLNGRTPAEAASIDLKLGENRWMNLIKQSAKAVKKA